MRQGILLLALVCLAGHATAQTVVNVTTFITRVTLTNVQPTFGQLQGYGTSIQVPTGQPNPPAGVVTFLNGTNTLVATNVNGANSTFNGNTTTVLGQDAAPLPVGTYNVINTAYGGYSQTVAGVTTNWLASTSLTLVPLLSFTVVAAQPPNNTIATQITALSLANIFPVYGQSAGYGTQITAPAGSAVPQGIISFLNGTTTLATASLTQNATINSNNVIVNATDVTPLPVGTYNAFQSLYAGFSVTNTVNNVTTTWLGSSSTTNVPNLSFTVLPASTSLTFSFTPFTLTNFTQSFLLNVTNVNGTNVVPQGPTYEVIRNTNTGAVIGNYSLVYTQLNANTLAASLPSSFNASQSLTYGNYSAVITYDPTSNFLQPTPLTVLFSITNVTVPGPPVPVSPPPPPPPTVTPTPSPGGASPPPPPPLSPGVVPPPPTPPGIPAPPPPPPGVPVGPASVYQTVTALEVYFEKQKDWTTWLKSCKTTNLIFTAAVTGPDKTKVPQTGYVSFTLVPAGTPIGQGGVVPDNTLGLASVTIVKSPGNSGVYGIPPPGAYTVMATYSGDINGTFSSSSATAPLYISDNCASYCQQCTNSMIGSKFGSGGLLGVISSSWSQADDSVLKYSLSNGYDGNGYVDGHMYTPGSYYNGNNQPYSTPGAYYTPQSSGMTPVGSSSYSFQAVTGGQPKSHMG